MLKFVLAQLQPIHSTPRQRTLVALLVKLFAILGMRVAASLAILTVDSAMHVAGAVANIVLLLVLLCNQLVLTLRILRTKATETPLIVVPLLFSMGVSLVVCILTCESVLLLGLACSILLAKVEFTIITLLPLLFFS